MKLGMEAFKQKTLSCEKTTGQTEVRQGGTSSQKVVNSLSPQEASFVLNNLSSCGPLILPSLMSSLFGVMGSIIFTSIWASGGYR